MSNLQVTSAAHTATFNAGDNANQGGFCGVKAVLDVTVVPGVDTVQLVIEGKDSVSGKYWTLLQAAARVAVGTDVITVYPGLAAVANVSANDVLPTFYRARVVHSAGTSFTYSLALYEVH